MGQQPAGLNIADGAAGWGSNIADGAAGWGSNIAGGAAGWGSNIADGAAGWRKSIVWGRWRGDVPSEIEYYLILFVLTTSQRSKFRKNNFSQTFPAKFFFSFFLEVRLFIQVF